LAVNKVISKISRLTFLAHPLDIGKAVLGQLSSTVKPECGGWNWRICSFPVAI